jgi:PDZ domain-containing protein
MSSTEITLPPPLSTAPRRRRRRWPYVVGVLAAIVVGALAWAGFTTAPYYELTPGQAQSVASLISVPAAQSHTPSGKLLLTDVELNTMRYLQFIPAWLDSDASVVSTGELTGNLPVSEFDAQGTVDMTESQLTAAAVALRQLGYSVPERDAGVTVYVLDPSSPGFKVLHVGDVVTSLDGTPTPNPDALVAAVHQHRPGDTVTLQVGSIQNPTPGRAVTLRLGSLRDSKGIAQPFIGIGDPHVNIPSMGTQPVYTLPFPVNISSDNIGGPSAGLVFTLGIIDSLSGGHLTGGKAVAATGTIRPDGSIGDVGGVEQKTVAVERAGATLFLVPPQELAVAQSKANGRLQVKAVSTLAEALADLQQIGGSLGSAANGPPPGPDGHGVPYGWQSSPWT